MLQTLRNALKIKDIRSRIVYTFFMLIIIRIGSQLPIPGVNTVVFSAWFAAQTANGMGFFDAICTKYNQFGNHFLTYHTLELSIKK